MPTRFLAASALLLLALGAAAQTAPDTVWPRTAKGADGTVITVYQPQIERWADNVLSARAAVAVAKPGEKDPRYGVIELTARTSIDKAADIAMLSALRVTKTTFPGATQQETESYLATLRAAVTRQSWPVSVQALQSNLAITQARAGQKALPVKNDPPKILFSTRPAMLVLINGEPVLREVKDAQGLARIVNTTAAIFRESSSSSYYLWALGRWWQAGALDGEWKAGPLLLAPLDNARDALGKNVDPLEGKDADGKPLFEPGVTPQLIVATEPTELLLAKGEPQLTPIPGTQLLYMANSSSDIFMDVGAQTYYVLISGRWFSAKSLDGPWAFVPAKTLPGDFAKIPASHQMADVLMSVPGTPQAREAAIANQIPQTATVQRDIQATAVAYDGGEPKWQPIDSTPLSYAPNTASPVIRVDAKTYYMVQNGVWFSSTAPAGPWSVAATVPAVIYSIPPSSPMHYVSYVRVYSSTPSTVFVGYTPGYYGTVMSSDGVVVYGTGYVYPPYIGLYYPYYWYPYPATYGYGFGFSVGIFFGFAVGPPWYGGCCWGGPVVIHHGNFTVNNSYNRWGGKSTSITGPGGRNLKATQIGDTTLAKGSGSNNVYAGRDGDVYRRNESGDWQKYGGKGEGWSDLERPGGGARPEQRPAEGGARERERAQQRPAGETRSSLDRQHQSRQAGEMRSQQFRSGGGFQGGGGMRGGGGRGGGRR
ncbi:MAG TPA: carbohydrate-binding family V/XII [Burkholderiales bacterium]|nr:carbohydrate-binding family V/XII [Burkholderiales bacterium]